MIFGYGTEEALQFAERWKAKTLKNQNSPRRCLARSAGVRYLSASLAVQGDGIVLPYPGRMVHYEEWARTKYSLYAQVLDRDPRKPRTSSHAAIC